MSLNRRNARRDANELEIVKALHRAGASVKRLSDAGLPDLIVWFRGSLFLIEVKTKSGKLTEEQHVTLNTGWPVVVIHSVDEALSAIGVTR